MTSLLVNALATTDALAEIFSDRSVLQAMLDFEVALARAAAVAGSIPHDAAASIAAAARAEDFDAAAIARDARASATPAIPLVRALTERVCARHAAHAHYVHWGATSQDVTDSAMVVLLRRARVAVAADHMRLARALPALSDQHARSIMLGRTLLQPATPITFGLKVAGWYAALARAWARLGRAWDEARVVQLGGASGTRAAWGRHAGPIVDAVARELEVAPAAPWHTDRDRFGALLAGCGLYVAALGKMARDAALLMQAEVGELTGPGGGSSSMPHKRNPAGPVVVLAAATRVPGLVASFLSGMVQEHERAAGGGQAEWPTISAVVQTTGAAAAAMASTIEELSVDPARMRANLDATRGTVLAERAVMRLTPSLGRDRAQELVAEALARSRDQQVQFTDALHALPEAAAVLTPDELHDLARPDEYLGEAGRLRRKLLAEAEGRGDEGRAEGAARP